MPTLIDAVALGPGVARAAAAPTRARPVIEQNLEGAQNVAQVPRLDARGGDGIVDLEQPPRGLGLAGGPTAASASRRRGSARLVRAAGPSAGR